MAPRFLRFVYMWIKKDGGGLDLGLCGLSSPHSRCNMMMTSGGGFISLGV